MIVPVKSAKRKSRLTGLLSEQDREEFSRHLLRAVLSALEGAGLMDSCRVVSPDREMLELAAQAGSKTVAEERDEGVNSAVARGLSEVHGSSDVLVIPADLPLLLPHDLRRILRVRSEGLDVVIAPSQAFDGTNALLFNSSAPVPLSYDDASFWNHLAGAASRGYSVGVCTDEGLTFDVDSPDDFRRLAGSGSSGPPAEFARKALR